MGTWRWIVNGKEVRGEGETEEEAWANYNFVNPGPEHGGPGRGYPTPSPEGDATAFGKGAIQGFALDPIEGLIQLAEKSTGWKAPNMFGLRDWARNYRNQVQSTTAGRVGEIGGNIAGMAIPGGAVARGVTGATRAVGAASRALGAANVGRRIHQAAGVVGRGTAGALAGEAMPVQGAQSDEEYWRTKNNQALLGLGIGSTLPAVAQAASRYGAHLPGITGAWWHHPYGAAVGPVTRGVGAVGQRIPPAGAAGAAADIEEERRRDEE